MLDRKLPWGLVLFGVMIAVVLELAAFRRWPSRSASICRSLRRRRIFVGGLVRWVVDRCMRHEAREHASLSEEQLAAESDKSPGVLLASGYIAGGAIAGIIIAFLAGVPAMSKVNDWIQSLAQGNPFAEGPYSDALVDDSVCDSGHPALSGGSRGDPRASPGEADHLIPIPAFLI